MDTTEQTEDGVVFSAGESVALPKGSTAGWLKVIRATSRFPVEPFRLVPRGTKHDGCKTSPCASCRCYSALREVGDWVVLAANVAARHHDRTDGAALDAFLERVGAPPRKNIEARWRDEVLGEMLEGRRERARNTIEKEKKEPRQKLSKAERRELSAKRSPEERRAKREAAARARAAGAAAIAALEAGVADEHTRQVWARFCEDYPPNETIVWPHVYTYPLLCRAVPQLGSTITALLYERIHSKWKGERFKQLLRSDAKPFRFRTGMPIPLPARSVRIVPGDSASRGNTPAPFTLSFSLHGGRHQGGAEFRLPLVPNSARQAEELRALASGQWQMGQVSIEPDRRKKRGRWYLRFSYTRVVERPAVPIKWAAINRGLCVMLCSLVEDGQRLLEEGNDVEDFLKQIQARRRSYQRAGKTSNRRGHGRNRTLRPIEALEGKARRWRETWCQTKAREHVRWLAKQGVTDLIYEDFSGIRDAPVESLEGGVYVWQRIQEWPYGQLGSRIVACCDEVGIRTHKRDPAYNSQTCPKCGHVSPDNVDLRYRKLRCTKCGHAEHLDVAYCRNALERERSGGVSTPGVARKSGKAGKTARKAKPL